MCTIKPHWCHAASWPVNCWHSYTYIRMSFMHDYPGRPSGVWTKIVGLKNNFKELMTH